MPSTRLFQLISAEYILHMRKLRLKQMKQFAKGHTANK